MRIGKYIIFEKEKEKEKFDFDVLRGHIHFIVRYYNSLPEIFKGIKEIRYPIYLSKFPKNVRKKKEYIRKMFKKNIEFNKESLKNTLDNLAIHITELNNIFLNDTNNTRRN